MLRLFIYILFFGYSTLFLEAQHTVTSHNAKDSILTEDILQQLIVKQSPIEERIIQVGEFFIGTPYTGQTLETGGKEHLVVNLREMDCTTFVETVTALVLASQHQAHSFYDFCSALQKIRYRDGVIDQYPSRLHYFSDWIQNNIQKGIIEEVTPTDGSVTEKRQIDFMSSHADKYPALVNNCSYLNNIKETETRLSQIPVLYIPKDSLNSRNIRSIRNGDIIAITTTIQGLDISHVGLAYWMKDNLHLLHASLNKKQVTIESIPLIEQLQRYKTQSGIRVLRITDKKSR